MASLKNLGQLSIGIGVRSDRFKKDMKTTMVSGEKTVEKSSAKMARHLNTALVAGAAAAAAGIGVLGKKVWDIQSDFNKATRDMQSSLGVTEQVARDLAQQAKDVWENNWGESIEAITPLMEEIHRILGFSGDAAQMAAEHVLSLKDAFEGIDDRKVLQSVSVLQEMGLSAQHAFDFITAGFQQGLDSSGDFLDSINEYGVQFIDAGSSAEEMWSLFVTGQREGVLGLDKAADAFKEFRIRWTELGKDQAEAIAALDMTSLWKRFKEGQIDAMEGMNNVLQALGKVDNAVERNKYGVALFGTMWEDLGPKAMMSISTLQSGVEDFVGSTAALGQQYQGLGTQLEGVWRNFQVSLTPLVSGLTTDLFGLAGEDKDEASIITKLNTWIDETLDPWIAKIGTKKINIRAIPQIQMIEEDSIKIKTMWEVYLEEVLFGSEATTQEKVKKFAETFTETLNTELANAIASAWVAGTLARLIVSMITKGKGGTVAFLVGSGAMFFGKQILEELAEDAPVRKAIENFQNYWENEFVPAMEKDLSFAALVTLRTFGYDVGPDGTVGEALELFTNDIMTKFLAKMDELKEKMDELLSEENAVKVAEAVMGFGKGWTESDDHRWEGGVAARILATEELRLQYEALRKELGLVVEAGPLPLTKEWWGDIAHQSAEYIWSAFNTIYALVIITVSQYLAAIRAYFNWQEKVKLWFEQFTTTVHFFFTTLGHKIKVWWYDHISMNTVKAAAAWIAMIGNALGGVIPGIPKKNYASIFGARIAKLPTGTERYGTGPSLPDFLDKSAEWAQRKAELKLNRVTLSDRRDARARAFAGYDQWESEKAQTIVSNIKNYYYLQDLNQVYGLYGPTQTFGSPGSANHRLVGSTNYTNPWRVANYGAGP